MTRANDSISAPDHPPLLFPPPRSCERLAGTITITPTMLFHGDAPIDAVRAAIGPAVRIEPAADVAGATIRCRVLSATQSTESYSLRLRGSPALIDVESAGPRGSLHALSTLRQLVRQYGRTLPALAIRDEPAFSNRGVMLDVSRDRVPRMDELLRQVDQLAELKFNHLQLYTEHTFAYAGHEAVWEGWSPITPAEIRELDAFCRLRGMTLAANQNCFGHLASWLRHPRYAPLAEIQGADTLWKFYEYERRGPFSLCPTDPGSLALVRDMLSQLLPCFTSGLVNINCDETADVGQGRSRAEVERRGTASVYFEFIRAVADAVRERGFRPMFWADIALSHPEAVGQIPEDMIALAWGYEPDSYFGDWCRRLRDAGREAWVCPGTSSWRSITGRTQERIANIGAAVREGLAAGAKGFLITDWGDVGHRQQWPISLHGIAHAAHAAWSGGDNGPPLDGLSFQVFGNRSLRLAQWLDDFGDADLELRRVGGRKLPDGSPTHLRNASVLFNDLHPPFEGADRIGTADEWRRVGEELDSLRSTMPASDDAVQPDELTHALDTASFAAQRAVWRRSDPRDAAVGANLSDQLRQIISEHRRLWLQRSRSGGLESSCRHYEGLLEGLGRTR